MKRTLTAAAVLVSSAGALGFAGTATAAESPEFPADLPVDSNVAEAAFDLAGTTHSATRVVGDVVPVEQRSTGRDLTDRADGSDPIGSITDMATQSSLDDVVGWFGGSGSSTATKPAQNGAPGSSSTIVDGLSRDLLPLDGTAVTDGAVPGVMGTASGAVPQLVGETLPTQPAPARSLPKSSVKAAPQQDLIGGTVLKGVLPSGAGQSGSLVDEVGKVVSHGPLGGVSNLGGS